MEPEREGDDILNDPKSNSFNTVLDTFGLNQHIVSPTHSSGHILDLFITQQSFESIESGVFDPCLSDHSAIFGFIPNIVHPSCTRITKEIRKYSSIDITAFNNDIISFSLYSLHSTTLSEYLSQFVSVLSDTLNKHSPAKTIVCRSRPHKPFITPDILTEKAKRSPLESLYRRNKTDENLRKFRIQAKLVNRMITVAKRLYYRSTISFLQNNSNRLWKTFDSLLGR